MTTREQLIEVLLKAKEAFVKDNYELKSTEELQADALLERFCIVPFCPVPKALEELVDLERQLKVQIDMNIDSEDVIRYMRKEREQLQQQLAECERQKGEDARRNAEELRKLDQQLAEANKLIEGYKFAGQIHAKAMQEIDRLNSDKCIVSYPEHKWVQAIEPKDPKDTNVTPDEWIEFMECERCGAVANEVPNAK